MFSLFSEGVFNIWINYFIPDSIFALLISLPLPFIFCSPLLLYFSSYLFILFALGVVYGFVSTLQSVSVVIHAQSKLVCMGQWQ